MEVKEKQAIIDKIADPLTLSLPSPISKNNNHQCESDEDMDIEEHLFVGRKRMREEREASNPRG